MEKKDEAYVKSALRRCWRWTKARRECLKAKACAGCATTDKRKKYYADHIFAVVDPELGFTSWSDYIHRMFDGKLQKLCAVCHKTKTRAENALRRKCRADAKRKEEGYELRRAQRR